MYQKKDGAGNLQKRMGALDQQSGDQGSAGETIPRRTLWRVKGGGIHNAGAAGYTQPGSDKLMW